MRLFQIAAFVYSSEWAEGFRGLRFTNAALVIAVEPSGVQALKNPNPLKDVEG